MGRLIYLTLTSLDVHRRGLLVVGAERGVMAAVNADLAKVGTYLYGRRTYLTMAVWEADAAWARAVAAVCRVRGWTWWTWSSCCGTRS